MVFLGLASLGLALGFNAYHPVLGLGAVLLMGLNALAAVYPLHHLRGKDPFRVYLAGMLIRLALIGAAFSAVVALGGLSKSAVLAATLTGMIAYFACLIFEIRHFLTLNAFFASR